MNATTTRTRDVDIVLSDAAQWVRDTACTWEPRRAAALIEDFCRNHSTEESEALRAAVKQRRGW